MQIQETSMGEYTVKDIDLDILLRRYAPGTADTQEVFGLYIWKLPFHRKGQAMLVEALKTITTRPVKVVKFQAGNGHGTVTVQYLDVNSQQIAPLILGEKEWRHRTDPDAGMKDGGLWVRKVVHSPINTQYLGYDSPSPKDASECYQMIRYLTALMHKLADLGDQKVRT